MVMLQSVEFVRSLACLVLEDGRKVWLTRADFLESGWFEGTMVEEAAFDRFVRLRQYPRALNQAVAMLARRPCGKGEILQRLKRGRFTDEVAELVVLKLEKEHLLDDREFSELWVRQRAGKYGVRRIRQELRAKGVPEDLAEEALAGVSGEEQLLKASDLAAKAWSRAKPGEDPRKTRQKIIASLVRKGYDWDIAKQAVDAAADA